MLSGIKEIIYHDGHKAGQPTRTVCLLLAEETAKPVARGEAKRSLKDNFNRKRGREIAVGRARKALATGISMFDSGASFYKREYWGIFAKPNLSPYEHELVEGVKKARAAALEGGE